MSMREKKKETKRPLNYIQLAGKYAISVENLISAIPMQKTGPKRRIWSKLREVTATKDLILFILLGTYLWYNLSRDIRSLKNVQS